MKRALITGVTGQDGAYLAQLLLSKGYTVFGAFRRSSSPNFWRLRELKLHGNERLHLIEFDITDADSCKRAVDMAQPNEIYNLAAQSFVGTSFTQPHYTSQATGLGVLNLLEAVRTGASKSRFYQASSSEMYGKVVQPAQDEATPFNPRSPYGVAKVYAHWMTKVYRESYNMHASCGILFNHESPLRGMDFVTRKISLHVARFEHGLTKDPIRLGHFDAHRDWGYAPEYVEGMWRMLQMDAPSDYVLATGKAHSIRDFLRTAFSWVGYQGLAFAGTGDDEQLVDGKGRVLAVLDPVFTRPNEVEILLGAPEKAARELSWGSSTTFEDLVGAMVEADLNRVSEGRWQ